MSATSSFTPISARSCGSARELKRSGDPDAGGAKAELQPMREQIKAARKATHEAVLNVLTPEQRQQLEQWRAEHPRKRG